MELRGATQNWRSRNAFDSVKVRLIHALIEAGGFVSIMMVACSVLLWQN